MSEFAEYSDSNLQRLDRFRQSIPQLQPLSDESVATLYRRYYKDYFRPNWKDYTALKREDQEKHLIAGFSSWLTGNETVGEETDPTVERYKQKIKERIVLITAAKLDPYSGISRNVQFLVSDYYLVDLKALLTFVEALQKLSDVEAQKMVDLVHAPAQLL